MTQLPLGNMFLYDVGNLYTGDPWGIEVELWFGTKELHGPFSTERQAVFYAAELVTQRDLPTVRLVRIQPHVTRTLLGEGL